MADKPDVNVSDVLMKVLETPAVKAAFEKELIALMRDGMGATLVGAYEGDDPTAKPVNLAQMQRTPQLPRYTSIKKVWAAKIINVEVWRDPVRNGLAGSLVVRWDKETATIAVSDAYLNKHKPKIGGYYVRYEDGYESWSPAEAFEAGYVRD